MRCWNFIMVAAAALVLSACSTTLQVYSSPEHEALRLRQGDLRDGGLAFLTPSTVTGQEEDKQSLAHVFAAALQSERPELRFLSLSETISAVNRAGLAEAYRTMYQNYRDNRCLRRRADAPRGAGGGGALPGAAQSSPTCSRAPRAAGASSA